MKNQIKSYEALLECLCVDEQFKKDFIVNPKPALIEIGVNIPNSIEVKVHEDSLSLKNLVLPLISESQKGNFAELEPSFKAVIQRAWEDETFKEQLLHNPKAALKEVIGADLPDTLTICVYEDTPTVKHLVLPVNTVTEEISELELTMVAGGIGSRVMGYFAY